MSRSASRQSLIRKRFQFLVSVNNINQLLLHHSLTREAGMMPKKGPRNEALRFIIFFFDQAYDEIPYQGNSS